MINMGAKRGVRIEEGILGNPNPGGRLEEVAGREDLGAEGADREENGTLLNPAEYRRMVREEFGQNALPQPPAMPGFHTCWLSTTNSNDPISRRIKMGYVPVKFKEAKGFDESYRMKTGEYQDCISCNEMLLFKIPSPHYLAIMEEFHHNMPREEEQKLRDAAKDLGEDAFDRNGKPLIETVENDEGFTELGTGPRKAKFQH